MVRPGRLTVPMRDAWLLVAEAVAAGLEESARGLADRAVDLSGWDRYRLSETCGGVQLRRCELLPTGWGYLAVTASGARMLLHDTGFVVHLAELDVLLRRIPGPGLFRLDVLLGQLLVDDFTVPEHP